MTGPQFSQPLIHNKTSQKNFPSSWAAMACSTRNFPAHSARSHRRVPCLWGRPGMHRSGLQTWDFQGTKECNDRHPVRTSDQPLTSALRIIPLLQTGFHEQQQLLWNQMDRVRSRDLAYVPRGKRSPRTGSPNPVRPLFHRTDAGGDSALDPEADDAKPQYFYETEPVLTPVCHTSVTPRPRSARTPRAADPLSGTPRVRSARGGLYMLSHGGLSLKPPGLRSRPLSAPSVRKLSSTPRDVQEQSNAPAEVRAKGRRPWSASAATRAAVGMHGCAERADEIERVLSARMRIMEDIRETSLGRETSLKIDDTAKAGEYATIARRPSSGGLSIDLANINPDSARTPGRHSSARPWSARSEFAISERAASLSHGVVRYTSRGTWNGAACENWTPGTGRHTAVQASYRRRFLRCPRTPSVSIGSSSQPAIKNRDGVWGSSAGPGKQQLQGERDGGMIADVIMSPRFDGSRAPTRQIPRPHSIF